MADQHPDQSSTDEANSRKGFWERMKEPFRSIIPRLNPQTASQTAQSQDDRKANTTGPQPDTQVTKAAVSQTPSPDTSTSALSPDNKPAKQLPPWLKMLGISIAGYLPALLIVLMSAFLFKSTITSSQDGKQTDQILTDKEKKKMTEEITKDIKQELERQQKQAKESASEQNAVVANITKSPNAATSVLVQGYIDAKINEKFIEKNQEVAKQAAEDKIEEVRAVWKEDLLDKIVFPVVFTIASIFAAFAVKDVLMEILKEQERGKIKAELQKDLKDYLKEYLVVHIVEEKQKPLTNALKAVETSTYWLEHELLNIEINQIINEINDSSLLDSNEIRDKSQLAIQKLFDRANLALDNISFKNDDLSYFRKAENKILSTKLIGLGLSQVSETVKRQKIRTEIDQIGLLQESKYERIDNLFEVQMSFMIATLKKLQEKTKDPEEKSAIGLLIDSLISHLGRDRHLEAWERRLEAIATANPPLNFQSSRVQD